MSPWSDWLVDEKTKARTILLTWAWAILIFGGGLSMGLISSYVCFLLQTGLFIPQMMGFILSCLSLILFIRVLRRIWLP